MWNILRPFAAHIDNDTIAYIGCLAFLEIITDGLAELELRFFRLWLLQNDIDDTAHRLSTVKR